MLKAILHNQLKAFEKAWGYDATYMHEMLDTDLAGFLRFSIVSALAHPKGAPPAALAAAGITATMAEDCGPCTQIGVDMAAKGGVPAAVLRAVLAGDEAAMGPDAALGYRFAKAVLARDLEASDALRDEVVRRWGRRGVTALGFALSGTRLFPTMKYAMGHGRACSRIVVEGQAAPLKHPEPLAA